jgi:L-seryl-tRNA(Ser) seleniumtransferase
MRPPSVDTLARTLNADPTAQLLPQALRVTAARQGIASVQRRVEPAEPGDYEAAAVMAARQLVMQLLQPVINATGTLLHTNLGRAPRLAVSDDTSGSARYSSLEFDLNSGKRGSRRNHASSLLAQLSAAESALVVNNCAAALMLVVAAIATGRGVAVSRGELVEIGGAFRIPDVLTAQGAQLVEVGTTNRTRLTDYEAVLDSPSANVGMVLSVHRSNYRISGFTESATIGELATASRTRGVPLVVDTGSGLLDARLPWLADAAGRVPHLPWLAEEPGSKQTLEAGADLIVFSGDKLLGGPQAGIIAGRKDLVERCARHPLARALRPGGSVLGELQQVCVAYLDRRASEIPFWEMATRSVDELRARAEVLVELIGSSAVTAVPCTSVPGGGTLPDAQIDSIGLLITRSCQSELRAGRPPIISRATPDGTLLDLRTIDPADDQLVAYRVNDIVKQTKAE